MRSPVAALLWESWRLTRVEMAFRMALAVIIGGAPLAASRALDSFSGSDPASLETFADASAIVTLFLMAVLAFPFWFSIALLKGGRLIDGGNPGFPFTIGYARPVTTGLLVGVPLTYFAVANAALYLVPALVLGILFRYSFPLAPFVAWIVVLSLVQAATSWWTRSKTIQLAGSMASVAACMWLLFRQIEAQTAHGSLQDANVLPAQWPTLFAFHPGDYGVMGALGAAAIALAIAGVARQRHGDTSLPERRAGGAPGARAVRTDAFRVPCPTATPVLAQCWLESTRTGVPLLAVGCGLALAIPALLTAVNALGTAPLVALTPVMLAPFVVLRMGIDNVFGLQRKPGRTYAGTFDASQAIGTLPLVTIKVLVRASCFLLALAALGTGVWWSVPLLQGWPTILPSNYEALISGRRAIASAIEALNSLQGAALAVLIVSGVSTTVACAAALQVFRLLHPMRVYGGSLALIVYTLMFLLWSRAASNGVEVVIMEAYPWVLAAAISLPTLYVFRLALMERLLTAWHAAGAVLLWVACVVSWLVLTRGGLDMAAMPWGVVALTLSLSLLPATAVALTPWTYSLVRHS